MKSCAENSSLKIKLMFHTTSDGGISVTQKVPDFIELNFWIKDAQPVPI